MQLHSQQDALPWPAADAPLGQVLSGWHSQGLGGEGYNQWVVDDHPGQLRMRLASSTANSQLNLGYVMSHGATGGERGSWRGTGAELRTDAWAVVRAGGGLLLSTTAQPRAGGTLLDAHEARGQLTAAQKTAQRLSDAASSQQALPLAANEAFDPLTQALDPAQDGHYDSNVNGQDATQPNKAPVERFGQPWLATESPTSIALASQATTTVYAGRHLHGTAQGDWHLAAGNVIAAAAAKGVSLFAQRNGVRVIAEGGPVSIQAHTDALAVLADKAVTVTSSAASVEILAQQNIVLHGGDGLPWSEVQAFMHSQSYGNAREYIETFDWASGRKRADAEVDAWLAILREQDTRLQTAMTGEPVLLAFAPPSATPNGPVTDVPARGPLPAPRPPVPVASPEPEAQMARRLAPSLIRIAKVPSISLWPLLLLLVPANALRKNTEDEDMRKLHEQYARQQKLVVRDTQQKAEAVNRTGF
ncbi:Uncharacterized protein conserved in bacteria [Ralstonia mannitolilytica]|nr:Uncharacterized protein conserved in bacteria [Ralstonia mannitolilytica]